MTVDMKAAYKKLHDWLEKSGLERVKDPANFVEMEKGKLCRVCLLGACYNCFADKTLSSGEYDCLRSDICRRIRAAGDTVDRLDTIPDRKAMLKFFAEGAGL